MSSSRSEAFSSVKIVCKFLGICIYKDVSLFNSWSFFINIILIVFQLTLILPSLAYFLRYLSNVDKAAEVLSILFPSILHLWQYLIIIFTKSHLETLFHDFEELIEKSTLIIEISWNTCNDYIFFQDQCRMTECGDIKIQWNVSTNYLWNFTFRLQSFL